MGTSKSGARDPGSGARDGEVGRRRAIRTIAAGALGAATSSAWVESLTAFTRQQAHAHVAGAVVQAADWTPRVLTAKQNDLIVTLTELIIPQTDTPGAKVARVNRFIDFVLERAAAANRARFVQGLDWLDERSRTLYKRDFLTASAADQASLLASLADQENKSAVDQTGVQFFQAIKSMTIDGYYTSEIGLLQELGDSPQMFLAEFPGCDHPEHQ
ncbi:MAG: gluconate 2-dehydrogenase subunit 3 family protein [Vicinamibacterales bacterium]